MKPIRISHLNAAQVEAVFRSELFCQLTDSQLAALHHRSQQLEAQQQAALHRKRRQRWLIAAAVVVLAAIAPGVVLHRRLLGAGTVRCLGCLAAIAKRGDTEQAGALTCPEQ